MGSNPTLDRRFLRKATLYQIGHPELNPFPMGFHFIGRQEQVIIHRLPTKVSHKQCDNCEKNYSKMEVLQMGEPNY